MPASWIFVFTEWNIKQTIPIYSEEAIVTGSIKGNELPPRAANIVLQQILDAKYIITAIEIRILLTTQDIIPA